MTRARPTGRGIVVLAGALVAYLVGWLFGTRELAALAVVLALALPLALVVVVRASRLPFALVRRLPARAVAGERLVASLAVEPAPGLVAASLVDRCARLGDPVASLVRSGDGLRGSWELAEPPRGRYELLPELVLEDAFGLVRVGIPLDRRGLLRVEPRLVELADVRAPTRAEREGTRHAFASTSGDGIAGVRDHEVGESLRRVHWRTSARRGRLTVRELEEHPREQLTIVLDASAEGAGEAFECAVRAAGSLALHAVRSGVSVSFESSGSRPVRLEIGSSSASAALVDALCAIEPDGAVPIADLLAGAPGARICVVGCDVGQALVERVRALSARRRAIAIVAVDAASFGGASTGFDAGVAELARSGAVVVVVRRGDDLAHALAPVVGAGVAGAA